MEHRPVCVERGRIRIKCSRFKVLGTIHDACEATVDSVSTAAGGLETANAVYACVQQKLLEYALHRRAHSD